MNDDKQKTLQVMYVCARTWRPLLIFSTNSKLYNVHNIQDFYFVQLIILIKQINVFVYSNNCYQYITFI